MRMPQQKMNRFSGKRGRVGTVSHSKGHEFIMCTDSKLMNIWEAFYIERARSGEAYLQPPLNNVLMIIMH